MRMHRPLPVSTIAIAAALAVSAFAAQNNAADAAKLIDVLQVQPGHTVAEIGAGSGELTMAIARHVGPTGRVLTSELGADRLARLRKAVASSGLGHIQVREGDPAHANLDEGCCDAVFMRNVYHHFADSATMNASIARALKPGARIAVIDFTPRHDAPVGPPGKRDTNAAHGVSAAVVARELEAAGLQIVTSEDRGDTQGQRWFLVVATRPR
jgi:ubiquinone/menaquinone biosynthesis C-methylase UbiE